MRYWVVALGVGVLLVGGLVAIALLSPDSPATDRRQSQSVHTPDSSIHTSSYKSVPYAGRFHNRDALNRVLHATEIESGPALTWRNAIAMPSGDARNRAVWQVLRAWIEVDPRSALQALDDYEDNWEPHVLDQWRGNLVTRWAKSDVRAALGWVLARPQSSQRRFLVASAAKVLTSNAPLAAVEIAFELDVRAQREIDAVAFQPWATHDATAALEALEDPEGRQFDNLMRHGLVAAWASVDPHAAFYWARSQPYSPDYPRLVDTPLQILARTEPKEALALADELDEDARRIAVASVFKTWADSAPSAAADWIIATSYHQPDAIMVVVSSYARLNIGAAFDWVSNLPLDLLGHATPPLMSLVTQNSLSTALGLMDRIGDPMIRKVASKNLVYRWMEFDPHGALYWIGAQENIQTRRTLSESAFLRWSQIDREDALAAVQQLPEPTRDRAMLTMISSALASRDKAFVDELFIQIGDEQSRSDAAKMIYSHLRGVDSDRAARYRELAGR